MRKLLLSAALAFGLASCTAAPNGTTTGVGALIQNVCHVVADANALQVLIATFPIGTQALTIANAFCAAVNKGGGGAKGQLVGSVTLRGVTVPYTKLR